jgi:hypothetical protein
MPNKNRGTPLILETNRILRYLGVNSLHRGDSQHGRLLKDQLDRFGFCADNSPLSQFRQVYGRDSASYPQHRQNHHTFDERDASLLCFHNRAIAAHQKKFLAQHSKSALPIQKEGRSCSVRLIWPVTQEIP